MKENNIESIGTVRLLDNVVQYNNSGNNTWKPFVNSISNETTGFNLQLYHIGKYIRVNSASDVEVNIPSLGFPIGSSIVLEQTGEGTITITASSDTLNGKVLSNGQYSVLQIIKVENNVWTVIGGVE